MSRPLAVVLRLSHSLFVGQLSSPMMDLHEAARLFEFVAGTAAAKTEDERPWIMA